MVPIYHASLYSANFLPNCNSCYTAHIQPDLLMHTPDGNFNHA